MMFPLFVSCPKGLEYLLQDELVALGFQVQRVSPQGVYGDASLTTLYQLALWSRLANRLQLVLFSGEAHNDKLLYQLCRQFPWHTVFSADKTVAITFHGTSATIRHSMYGAQVIKDALVDHFRALQGTRPLVDKASPEILIHAHLKQGYLTVSLDLIGYSLHQRGYRRQQGAAPLKENIAAALLLRSHWPQLAKEGYALHDPFCGAGTLVIEAAMMAAFVAPGLLRTDQALCHWLGHQEALWQKLREQALQAVKPLSIPLIGSDEQQQAIAMAKANAERAGVARLITWVCQPLSACRPLAKKGLVLTNPPYGERLSEPTVLVPLYQQFGLLLRHHYQDWKAAVLTTNPVLAKATGLHAFKQYAFFNGPLACKLYCLMIEKKSAIKETPASKGAQMLANRLQKNSQHLQKWARRNDIHCYRLYDADLPEYAFAIDYYDGYFVLQEYLAPKTIAAAKVEARRVEVLQVVTKLFNVPLAHLVMKQRQRQKGKQQYGKMGHASPTMTVKEGSALFKINLYDYLDTGIFLDHRLLRLHFNTLKPGTRFLNCFCYTATASVHAALAGAKTTNVDLSTTYLQWAKDNFALNKLNLDGHQFIQADALSWLKQATSPFDVIFLDPPSFSNSKKMRSTLDIQRDHVLLIEAAMKLLVKEGLLYFSTNLKRFKLAEEIKTRFTVKDITTETIDKDFKRADVHTCFLLKKQ